MCHVTNHSLTHLMTESHCKSPISFRRSQLSKIPPQTQRASTSTYQQALGYKCESTAPAQGSKSVVAWFHMQPVTELNLGWPCTISNPHTYNHTSCYNSKPHLHNHLFYTSNAHLYNHILIIWYYTSQTLLFTKRKLLTLWSHPVNPRFGVVCGLNPHLTSMMTSSGLGLIASQTSPPQPSLGKHFPFITLEQDAVSK
jgi:hypothetical protein